jgi:hypothetical protein
MIKAICKNTHRILEELKYMMITILNKKKGAFIAPLIILNKICTD